MKRAIILHGKDGHGHAHWFPWLKAQLESRGYTVWVPDLPDAATPSAKRWTEALLSNKAWDFQDNLVIGHSAGGVEIFQLAQALPDGITLRAGVACAAFSPALAQDSAWHELRELFVPQFDFAKIRQHCRQFVLVHAKDDPWCPLDQAAFMANQSGGELVVLPTGRHFTTSLDPEFKHFPGLIDVLEERSLL
jgi:predicted alpha/beta hydrolase family esterase